MKRIIRPRRLTLKEVDKYQAIRELVRKDLPLLLDRKRRRDQESKKS